MTPRVAGGVAVLAGVAGVAGMTVLGGVAPAWAALLGVPVTVLALLVTLSPPGVEPVWSPLPEPSGKATEHMAASLSSRLSEAYDSPRRYLTRLQPRVARLALARLRRAGIDDLHDPRAPDVLGEQLYRLATDPSATLPDPKTAAALFARLEEG